MIEKQIKYIRCLEDAADNIHFGYCTGCCTAIAWAVKRQFQGIDMWSALDELLALFKATYKDEPDWLYYWTCDATSSRTERVIALSLMIDMIEMDNLCSNRHNRTEWHRLDFTDDMLTGGPYRPLLMLEGCQHGDEVLVGGRWMCSGLDWGAQMTAMHLPTRTKRPLP